MKGRIEIKVGAVELCFDANIGNIRQFSLSGRPILHRAHWVDTPEAAQSGSVIDAHLAGDFLAAPFGKSDILDDPPHGWSANSPWQQLVRAENDQSAVLKLALDRRVMGAHVTKEISLCADHPVLYQKHQFEGGQGALTYAHHPMIRVTAGDHIACSPKRAAVTEREPLEPAHLLACGARSEDLTRFPAHGGGTLDLTRYPARPQDGGGHEDFVTLVEAAEDGIGWTAVSRMAEGDIVLFLKDIATMPVTMLWMSNGGRPYAPWNGQHLDVLGVEDGCAAGSAGHLAAQSGRSAVAAEGVATTQSLAEGKSITLRHAIAVLSQPEAWQGVAKLQVLPDRCEVIGLCGRRLEIPFDGRFFSV